MPKDVIDVFGFALHLAQTGKKHAQSKPLKGFSGAKRVSGGRRPHGLYLQGYLYQTVVALPYV
jgi:hypothetical protein